LFTALFIGLEVVPRASPQHLTPPVLGSAQLHQVPAVMSVATNPGGTEAWPTLSSPQHSTAPFARSPHVWSPPTATRTKLLLAQSKPCHPAEHVQVAVPVVSEQVPLPLHTVDGNLVAHVGAQVPLLSLSW
jgi:hypothetical protein